MNDTLDNKNGISLTTATKNTAYSVNANALGTVRVAFPTTPTGYKLLLYALGGFSADKDLSLCCPIYNGTDRCWVLNKSVAAQTGNITIKGFYYKII